MAGTDTGAKVVALTSHPAWRSARDRSRDIEEAMRRHPSSHGVHHRPAGKPCATVITLRRR